ncbi:MAG: ATP-binding protein, partial [Betaproteobacteria bacterium]|nr:ATP-binding protein [Betaproteobacteria bacterium]
RQTAAESSATVRARVVAARDRARARQGRANALLEGREIEQHCAPGAEGTALLKQAISRLGLSARACHRVLKVARSIADLAANADVAAPHIAEAIQYRHFDRHRA